MFSKNATAFNIFFTIIIAVFIISLSVSLYYREGKDLKVGLFGIEQVLHKGSPYDNPTDPNRPLFRYAPGFTILQFPFLLISRETSPFKFEHIMPSVFVWFLAEIAVLLASAFILLKLMPSASKETSIRNLKLSLLISLPLLGYELANGQNKLIALFFMLLAIFLFENNRFFLSSFFFCWALTVYIPLAVFIFYFLLKSKGKYTLSFIVGAVVVFVILPSLVFGFAYNLHLLKEWFAHCIKPFLIPTSYVSYIDLRNSSQSLPSAIGRMFVSGKSGHFSYFISPLIIHAVIRVFALVMLMVSCFAVWRSSKNACRSLGYPVFLSLALLLPQYCIFYTWSWLFVFYFAALNCAYFPQTTLFQKRILFITIFILFISSFTIDIGLFNKLSLMCWGTVIGWLGMVTVLIMPPASD